MTSRAATLAMIGALSTACSAGTRAGPPLDAGASARDAAEEPSAQDAGDATVISLGDAAFLADAVNPPPGELPSGSCGSPYFELTPDASPRSCAFTPADVACDGDTDCVTYAIPLCSCRIPVRGVNRSSTVRCSAPPCGVPHTDPCPSGDDYVTQYCQSVPTPASIAVACVQGECVTYDGR